MSASSDTISAGMAQHYKRELRTGKSRHTDLVLTPEERAVRIAALRKWGSGLSARYARDLKKDLEGFEKSLEDLKTQAAEHHKKSEEHHQESMEQLGGLHTKIDAMGGGMQAMTAVAALLTDNEVPPLKEGQTMQERMRQLQNRKRVYDIELSNVKVKAEKEKREEWLQQRRDGAAMQMELVGANLDSMSVDEAKEKLAEFKKMNRQIEKGFEADLRKRRVEEAIEARKAQKAKGANEAENGISRPPRPRAMGMVVQ
jgi:hypothetical protein